MSEPNSEKQDELRPYVFYKRKPITLGDELGCTVFLLVLGAGLIGFYFWLGEPDNLFVTVPLGALGVITILLLAFLMFDIVVTIAAATPWWAWLILVIVLIFSR